MEYWNNPKIICRHTLLPYPVDQDPIIQSMHNGEHVLYYDPSVHSTRISYERTVQDQCTWLNCDSDIWQDPFRIASIVKLNIYVQDIQSQGVVKPMLLFYDSEKLQIHTGENRMRASELLPDLVYFRSFITTHRKHEKLFEHLTKIENFEKFTEVCASPVGCQYQFRLTDQNAPYGIDWFEYDSERTRAVTPDYDWCETVFRNYLKSNSVIFTPDWFTKEINWKIYE